MFVFEDWSGKGAFEGAAKRFAAAMAGLEVIPDVPDEGGSFNAPDVQLDDGRVVTAVRHSHGTVCVFERSGGRLLARVVIHHHASRRRLVSVRDELIRVLDDVPAADAPAGDASEDGVRIPAVMGDDVDARPDLQADATALVAGAIGQSLHDRDSWRDGTDIVVDVHDVRRRMRKAVNDAMERVGLWVPYPPSVGRKTQG